MRRGPIEIRAAAVAAAGTIDPFGAEAQRRPSIAKDIS